MQNGTLSAKTKTVMLIDHNEIDNFIHQRILLFFSDAIQVITFRSSTDALEYLSKNKLLPQLIFLNLHLPMNKGFEFLECYEKLNIEKEKIPIYILTALISPSDLHIIEKSKYCCGFIEKPLTVAKLLEQIGKKPRREQIL